MRHDVKKVPASRVGKNSRLFNAQANRTERVISVVRVGKRGRVITTDYSRMRFGGGLHYSTRSKVRIVA